METLWNISIATPVVWRLTRMVSSAYGAAGRQGFGGAPALARLRPADVGDLGGSRVVDCLYWIGIWMSAQTALWVACGFAGVLLNWFALAGLARLSTARLADRVKILPLTARNAASATATCPAEDRSGVAQLCR